MQICENIVLKTGNGFGRQKDESDDLAKQTYAEKLIFSDEFIEALENLRVSRQEGNTVTGGNIMLTNDDVLPFRDDKKEIGMNGLCHKFNQVFVAGRMPFYATSYCGENTKKVKTVKSRGNNIGDEYTATKADMVRVYRISQEWDIDNYAVIGSANLKKTAYHEPTLGMKLRTEKIMKEKEIAF